MHPSSFSQSALSTSETCWCLRPRYAKKVGTLKGSRPVGLKIEKCRLKAKPGCAGVFCCFCFPVSVKLLAKVCKSYFPKALEAAPMLKNHFADFKKSCFIHDINPKPPIFGGVWIQRQTPLEPISVHPIGCAGTCSAQAW